MAAKQQWTLHHVVVFILTFMSYACFHATRKAFSNVKDSMTKEWTPHNESYPLDPSSVWESRHFFDDKADTEIFLGALDTAFLSAYAVGLFISGLLGDRFNLRRVLSFGMCSSAVMVFMFGTLSKWLKIYNKWYLGIFWALNGLLQSTGWPSVVAVMGNWFGKSSRGLVFGLWSACASVGNIFGALEAAAVLDYGYEYAMLLPAVLLFAMGIVVFFCLIPSPVEVGLSMPEEDQPIVAHPHHVFNDTEDRQISPSDDKDTSLTDSLFESASHQSSVLEEPKKAVSFLEALVLPGVIPYSLSYACLKLVNYSFFFWLPFYLSNKFHWKDTVSDKISTFYDVGGIVGGTIAGIVTDHMRSRSPVVVLMLFLSIFSLLVYGNTGGNYTTNAALMTVTGFMIGGPANLISAAISADLGRQPSLRENSEALATVTGIVDGTGSVGAAIGQILVPVINTHYGWGKVFLFLMIMTALSLVCIIVLPIYDFFMRHSRRREPLLGTVYQEAPPAPYTT